MNDIFVGNKTLDLTLYYSLKKNKNGNVFVTIVKEDDALKMLLDPDKKDDVQKLLTKWSLQGWLNAHNLVTSSMQYDHTTGNQKFNPHIYRDAKLKQCLIDWDCKDSDGSTVPCNEMTINNLHWQIAAALIDLYEEATEPKQDDATKT